MKATVDLEVFETSRGCRDCELDSGAAGLCGITSDITGKLKCGGDRAVRVRRVTVKERMT